jgi:hypothetical protein
MDSVTEHVDDGDLMNRILLLGYLTLAALILVFVAMVTDQIRWSDAQVLAVVPMLLGVADIALQRRRQPSLGAESSPRPGPPAPKRPAVRGAGQPPSDAATDPA